MKNKTKFLELPTQSKQNQGYDRKNPRGSVAKGLNCDIFVNDFELKSRY